MNRRSGKTGKFFINKTIVLVSLLVFFGSISVAMAQEPPPLPDLVVTQVVSPGEVNIQEVFEVSWTGENLGDGKVWGRWYDELYLSADDQLDSSDILIKWVWHEDQPLPIKSYDVTEGVSIIEGRMEDRSIECYGPVIHPGSWYLLIVADSKDYVQESNEENNVLARPIMIGESDLVISDILAPEMAFTEQQIELSYIVENQGDGDAITRDTYRETGWDDGICFSTDDQWDLYIKESAWAGPDVMLYLYEHEGILPPSASYEGKSMEAFGEWPIIIQIPDAEEVPSSGDYYIVVKTDLSWHDVVDNVCPVVYRQVYESNEGNNVLAVPITILSVKPGDILLCRSPKSFVSVSGEWTHAAMYVGDGRLVEAVPEVGVRYSDISMWTFSYKTWVEVLRVQCPDEIREKAVSFVKKLADAERADPSRTYYDLPIILPPYKDPDPNSKGWYCSELVWAAYFNYGVNIEDGPDGWLVTPQELHDSSNTICVGEHKEIYPPGAFGIKAKSPVDIIITDPEPTADFNAVPTSGPEPLTVEFTDLSICSYDDIDSWSWDFGDGETSNEQNPIHTYMSSGTYTVALTVTDADADDDTATKEDYITVTTAGDTIPPVIESVTLDAYTTIPDATIHVTVEATDNVGVTSVTADGAALVETGSTWEGDITAPSGAGDYTLTIIAEDAAENVAETVVEYSVVTAPVADSNGPYAGNEGSPITFDASGSYDPDGSIVLYEWDFDSDGVYDAATSTAFFTWDDDHTGTAELRVTDNDGLSDTDTTTITVNNVAPTASFYVEQPEDFILPYHSLTFNGASTDAGWLDTHAATWDFGDGTIVSGTLTPIGTTTAEHAYVEPGTYTVTLTVTDDDGGVGDYEEEVIVRSAEEAAGIIIDQLEVSIVPAEAPKGVSQKIESAIDKLEQVIDFLDQGKYCDAINKLDGMITQIEGAIDQVNEQRCSVKECKGKKCSCIADEDADKLIESLEHAKQGAIAIRDFISAEHPECA